MHGCEFQCTEHSPYILHHHDAVSAQSLCAFQNSASSFISGYLIPFLRVHPNLGPSSFAIHLGCRFDAIVVSAEVGWEKPSKEIFEVALSE